MKIKFILSVIFFAILVSCSKNRRTQEFNFDIPQDADFALVINYSTREASKDTHSDHYNVKVLKNNALVIYTHTGFPDNSKKEKNYTFSAKAMKNLIKYIKKNNLDRNLKESKKSVGLGRSVFVYLKLKLDNEITEITISGMYSDWQRLREGKKAGNIKNLDVVEKIRNIVMGIYNESGYF